MCFARCVCRGNFQSLAERFLSRHPEAESVSFAVGQYSSRAILDAVHHEILLSGRKDPPWPKGI